MCFGFWNEPVSWFYSYQWGRQRDMRCRSIRLWTDWAGRATESKGDGRQWHYGFNSIQNNSTLSSQLSLFMSFQQLLHHVKHLYWESSAGMETASGGIILPTDTYNPPSLSFPLLRSFHLALPLSLPLSLIPSLCSLPSSYLCHTSPSLFHIFGI